METNSIDHMVWTLTDENDYLTRKLAHYNEWLGDPKRKLGTVYPGFPEDEGEIGKRREGWGIPPKYKVADSVPDSVQRVRSGKKMTVVEQIEKIQAKAEAKKKPAKAKPAKSSGGSKQDRAVALYKEFNGDRKQTIQAIMEQLGMSTAGATTYFYNAKKLAA